MKAQTPIAAPVVLVILVVMIVVYMILAYPTEKLSLLQSSVGATQTPEDTTSTTSTSPPESVLLFKDTRTAEICNLQGQQIFNTNLGDIVLDYSTDEIITKSVNDVSLKATLFKSGWYLLNVKTNPTATRNLQLNLSISSVSGNPTIRIVVNNTSVYSAEVNNPQDISVIIPGDLLSNETLIAIYLNHNGYSFDTQSIHISKIKVASYIYRAVKDEDNEAISLVTSPDTISSVGISFNAESKADRGYLHILLNGEEMYKLIPDDTNSISFGVQEVDEFGNVISKLRDGRNIITFKVDKGSYYVLRNVSVTMYTESREKTTKTVYFDVPAQYLSDDYDLMVKVDVKTKVPGKLYIRIPAVSRVYVSNLGINSAYVKTLIRKNGLSTTGNELKLESPFGCFDVYSIKVYAIHR